MQKIYLKAINQRFIATIITIFYCSLSFAQSHKTGGWNIININYHLSDKFVLYGELQVRSQSLVKDFYYHEIKTGLTYNLPQKNSVFIGFGNYETYTYPGDFKKPVTANEYRLWEQFVLNNNLNRLRIEHRYRIEQRWINGTYSNRFRYRLNTVIPINHKSVSPHTLFMSAFDEVFFTDKLPYFIRNRVFGGAGYQFNSAFTLQMGFIRQFDYRATDNGSGKNFIQTSLLFNVNHIAAKNNLHLSNTD